jgi:hypothetical protein
VSSHAKRDNDAGRIELRWKSQRLPREKMKEENRTEMEVTEIAKRENEGGE